MRQVQFTQAFHGDGDQHHRRAEQDEAGAIEGGTFGTAQVGDEFPHGVTAQCAHGQVEQEYPVPGEDLDQPAAQRRA
ncbi:hypothetical protein D3C81_1781280 [compost metagenome]